MLTDDTIVKTFATTLKKLLKERGVTVTVVSNATKIPKSTLSEWMSERQPKLDESIVRLARFFGVSVEYLITGNHPEETIVKDIVDDLDNGFVSIHQGVYRINIEKYSRHVSKKPSGESK